METRELLNRIIKILVNPVFGWVKYQPEQFRFRDVLSPFFIMTVAVMFIARFVGKTLSYLPFADFMDILLYSAVMIAVDIVFYLIVVFFLSGLMPYFKISAGKARIAFLVYVSLVPFYLAMIILNLFPGLFFLALIFVYGFYVLYWGVTYFLKPSKDKVNIIFVVFILIIAGVYLVLNFALIYPFFEFIF
jgi:hypothetical protein